VIWHLIFQGIIYPLLDILCSHYNCSFSTGLGQLMFLAVLEVR
jgi:hypothetical protein